MLRLPRDAGAGLWSYLPSVANAALAILIGLTASRLFWAAWPEPRNVAPAINSTQIRAADRAGAVDLNTIASAALFGTSTGSAGAGQDPIDAPETKLDLLLTGIVSDTHGQRSLALIRHKEAGEEAAYARGDTVIDGVSLHRIHRNRVLLERGGRFETLTLADDSAKSDQPGSTAQNDAEESRSADEFVRDMIANPEKLTDFVTMRPLHQGGRMLGYRAYPTSKGREYFEALGVPPGVLIKSVNGLPLDGTVRLRHVAQELRQATQLNLVVGRQATRELTIDIGK